MNIIEYDKGKFINSEYITEICFRGGMIDFFMDGNRDKTYTVAPHCEEKFINSVKLSSKSQDIGDFYCKLRSRQ